MCVTGIQLAACWDKNTSSPYLNSLLFINVVDYYEQGTY